MAVTRKTLRLQDSIDELMRTITDRMQRDLQVAWASAWDEVRADLVMAVADSLAGGGRVTMTQMRQNRRLTRVLQMVLDRLEAVVDTTQVGVIAQMRALVDSAVAAQASIVDSQLPPGFDLTPVGRWSRVDVHQVDAMVTRTTQRIHSQSRPLAAQAVTAMKRELIRGISVGSNPRVTARRIVDRAGDVGFGGGLARAMVIARTETLDAYREGARIGQAPHEDVLDGWEWLATLSPRTCPACLSMHGREFPLSTPGPQGHQQCRCTRLPVVKAWDDLGIDGGDEPDDAFPSADEYFESLTPEQQRTLLGPRGYQAWLAGDFPREAWAVKRGADGWRDSWVNAKPPEGAGQSGGNPPTGPPAAPGATDGAPEPYRMGRVLGTSDQQKHLVGPTTDTVQGGPTADANWYHTYVPDAANRATALLQYHKADEGHVKEMARHLADGGAPTKDLLRRMGARHKSLVQDPLSGATSGAYSRADYEADVIGAARWLLDQPLVDVGEVYKGIGIPVALTPSDADQVAQAVNISGWWFSSHTPDTALAERYAAGAAMAHPTAALVIVAGARAVVLRSMGRMAATREVLVSGGLTLTGSPRYSPNSGLFWIEGRWTP